MRSPTIRIATADDGERITLLAAQLGYSSGPEQTRERIAALSPLSHHVVYVAELDDGIIGWLHAHVHHTITDDASTEIAGLVVDAQFRGTGVGRALMAAAEEWARSQGCKSVRLRSNVVRSGAHAFYRRLGYEITKSQHAFRKQLC